MIASWMICSMTQEFVKKVMVCETSHKIWAILEALFGSQSRDRVMHYKAELSSIKKGWLSVSDFVQKIQTLSSQLALVGCYVSDETNYYQFVMD